MFFFKFLLNTDESTKREQISDHMFHHTATTRRLIGYYYEPGLYFRKNRKLIYGFYHPYSTKFTSQVRIGNWYKNTYFGGKIITKEEKTHYQGIIFTNLEHYIFFSIFLILLFKIPTHPFPWIVLTFLSASITYHYYRCYKDLKKFFTEYTGETEE